MRMLNEERKRKKQVNQEGRTRRLEVPSISHLLGGEMNYWRACGLQLGLSSQLLMYSRPSSGSTYMKSLLCKLHARPWFMVYPSTAVRAFIERSLPYLLLLLLFGKEYVSIELGKTNKKSHIESRSGGIAENKGDNEISCQYFEKVSLPHAVFPFVFSECT